MRPATRRRLSRGRWRQMENFRLRFGWLCTVPKRLRPPPLPPQLPHFRRNPREAAGCITTSRGQRHRRINPLPTLSQQSEASPPRKYLGRYLSTAGPWVRSMPGSVGYFGLSVPLLPTRLLTCPVRDRHRLALPFIVPPRKRRDDGRKPRDLSRRLSTRLVDDKTICNRRALCCRAQVERAEFPSNPSHAGHNDHQVRLPSGFGGCRKREVGRACAC